VPFFGTTQKKAAHKHGKGGFFNEKSSLYETMQRYKKLDFSMKNLFKHAVQNYGKFFNRWQP
jgi:hypothetical protein